MEISPDTVIIGGGIAGLACATQLHKYGRAIQLLEASDCTRAHRHITSHFEDT